MHGQVPSGCGRESDRTNVHWLGLGTVDTSSLAFGTASCLVLFGPLVGQLIYGRKLGMLFGLIIAVPLGALVGAVAAFPSQASVLQIPITLGVCVLDRIHLITGASSPQRNREPPLSKPALASACPVLFREASVARCRFLRNPVRDSVR